IIGTRTVQVCAQAAEHRAELVQQLAEAPSAEAAAEGSRLPRTTRAARATEDEFERIIASTVALAITTVTAVVTILVVIIVAAVVVAVATVVGGVHAEAETTHANILPDRRGQRLTTVCPFRVL